MEGFDVISGRECGERVVQSPDDVRHLHEHRQVECRKGAAYLLPDSGSRRAIPAGGLGKHDRSVVVAEPTIEEAEHAQSEMLLHAEGKEECRLIVGPKHRDEQRFDEALRADRTAPRVKDLG